MMRHQPAAPGTWAAYEDTTAVALRQRLAVFATVFTLFMGLGTVVECRAFPARSDASILYYVLEAIAAITGAVAIRWAPFRRWPRLVGAWSVATVMLLIVHYHALVHAPAERVAMVLAAVLSVLAVLFPWGWPAQTLATLPGIFAFAHALGALETIDAPTIPAVTLVASATASVLAAYFMDRYRFQAFHREVLQAEEAAIAATLLRVAQTLGAHLDHPDMLGHVNALAIEALGCDRSALFLPVEDGLFALASSAGQTPEDRTELAQLRFSRENIQLFHVFRPGEVVEIVDPDAQDLVPAVLIHRFGNAAVMYAPIYRGDQLIGVLLNGWRTPRSAFSSRERRLALGIALAVAVALDNDRLIAALQAASRLKSEFVATMSHELRTPLNVIVGYSEMLADQAFEAYSPAWNAALASVQRAAGELTDLVSATLDLSRLDSGRDPVDRGPVDLAHLLAALATEVEPLVGPAVTLRWQATIDHGAVFTDGTKLKTILKNLVVNALKFTTVGAVDITAEGDEGTLVLRVRDTGIGIAPESQGVIFEMFRQADGSSTRRFGGVGLGLHIVQRLVRLLGGTVAVESTSGAGSTFTVWLPGAVWAAPAGAAAPDLR